MSNDLPKEYPRTAIDELHDELTGIIEIPGSFMVMSYEQPPVWEEIMRQFNINVASTLFTFGDVIYNPARVHIPEDFIRHEECHAEQQGHTPEGAGVWWARYFQDPYFRIDQEARAFAHQYDCWCKKHKDRNQRNNKMLDLSWRLARPTYGEVVNESGAQRIIRRFITTKR